MDTDLSFTASDIGTEAPPRRRTSIGLFWLAAAITATLYHVPYASYLLYPFGLLGTWAHELGHGIAAVLVGGRFDSLHLFADLGGVTYSFRPPTALSAVVIAAGGLLGPALAGGITVYASARRVLAPAVPYAFAIALLLSAVLWVRNPFGISAVLLLAAAFGAVAWWVPSRIKLLFAQLTGIQLCLTSLMSFDYMFTRDFVRNGTRQISDTQAIAEHLLLPYWFWGGVIALLSVLILSGAFWLAWLRPRSG